MTSDSYLLLLATHVTSRAFSKCWHARATDVAGGVVREEEYPMDEGDGEPFKLKCVVGGL